MTRDIGVAYIVFSVFGVGVYLAIVHLVAVYQYKVGKYKQYREVDDFEDKMIALDAWLWPMYFLSNIFWFVCWLIMGFIRFAKHVAGNLDD